ncbi:CidA/LrgA family protein [Xanthobacter sp. VTT E-85241]|uniref:CidA/LrgA family protein n=1 Tax=Roseixanthobacter finlandensis TaxID=3119922 RepID=UPI003726D4BD
MSGILTRLRLMLRRTRVLQILVLLGFWLAGDTLVRWLHLPLPGGVVGMGLLLVLLATGVLRAANVRLGAYWLLAEMLLFFVPAVMAVMEHGEFVGTLGLKIGAVILIGTVAVMGTTALIVDFAYRFSLRHSPRHAGEAGHA